MIRIDCRIKTAARNRGGQFRAWSPVSSSVFKTTKSRLAAARGYALKIARSRGYVLAGLTSLTDGSFTAWFEDSPEMGGA